MKILQWTILALSATIAMSFISGKKPSLKLAMKNLKDICVYVPSGITLIERDTVAIQGFYISQGEVTNLQYREFLADLKRKGEVDKYNTAKVDTMLWKTEFNWENNAYAEHYHDHPAYDNFPVVNISKEGAELYCEWLTEKYDSLSNGELKLKFRLPLHAEWIRAARGSLLLSSYTWGGPYLRNSKGDYLANFLNYGSENITRNEETGKLEITTKDVGYTFGDHADVTAPSISYNPNEFGIYNMNGNVSELVSDKNIAVGGDWRSPGYDIRINSAKLYKGASVTVGFRVVATYLEPSK